MVVISIMNVKGGVGKTITAVNLAEILAGDHEQRVLLVDADPQANATEMLLTNQDPCGLYEALRFGGCVDDYTQPTRYRNLDILAGSDDLFYLPIDEAAQTVKAMGDIMEALREDGAYDYVIIDCPPAFQATSVASICSSDGVVIPVRLDAWSQTGARYLIRQIETMADYNPRCQVLGTLPTMYHNAAVCNQALEALSAHNLNPFPVCIRRTDKVDESTFMGMALQEYSKFSAAGRDYRRFAELLLDRVHRLDRNRPALCDRPSRWVDGTTPGALLTDELVPTETGEEAADSGL
jgi:chromosome partitioning protein